jgi:hypothetical protein
MVLPRQPGWAEKAKPGPGPFGKLPVVETGVFAVPSLSGFAPPEVAGGNGLAVKSMRQQFDEPRLALNFPLGDARCQVLGTRVLAKPQVADRRVAAGAGLSVVPRMAETCAQKSRPPGAPNCRENAEAGKGNGKQRFRSNHPSQARYRSSVRAQRKPVAGHHFDQPPTFRCLHRIGFLSTYTRKRWGAFSCRCC